MNDAKERRRGYGRRGTDTFRAEQEMKRMTGQLSEPSGGLREAARHLVDLHVQEQEGLQLPTPDEWMDAVDALAEQLGPHLGPSTPKPPESAVRSEPSFDKWPEGEPTTVQERQAFSMGWDARGAEPGSKEGVKQ